MTELDYETRQFYPGTPKQRTTAINHEWDGPYTAPYVGWSVDTDEDELDSWIKASNRWFKFWLAFYKIKRWLRRG